MAKTKDKKPLLKLDDKDYFKEDFNDENIRSLVTKVFDKDYNGIEYTGYNNTDELIEIIKTRRDKIILFLNNELPKSDINSLSLSSKLNIFKNNFKNNYLTCCYKRLTLINIIISSENDGIRTDAYNILKKLNNAFLNGNYNTFFIESVEKKKSLFEYLKSLFFDQTQTTDDNKMLWLCYSQIVIGRLLYQLFDNIPTLYDVVLQIGKENIVNGKKLFFKNHNTGIDSYNNNILLEPSHFMPFTNYKQDLPPNFKTPHIAPNYTLLNDFSDNPSLFLYSGISSYRLEAFLSLLLTTPKTFHLPFFLSTSISRDMAIQWATLYTGETGYHDNILKSFKDKKHVIVIEVPWDKSGEFPFAYFPEGKPLNNCGECEIFTNIYNKYKYISNNVGNGPYGITMFHHLRFVAKGVVDKIYEVKNLLAQITPFIEADAIEAFRVEVDNADSVFDELSTGGSKRKNKGTKRTKRTKRKNKRTKLKRKSRKIKSKKKTRKIKSKKKTRKIKSKKNNI